MVKKINIHNISAIGINSDISPWDLPHNAITDLMNVRIANNKLYNYKGASFIINGFSNDEFGHIVNVNAESDFWVVAGDNYMTAYNLPNAAAIHPIGVATFGVDQNLWTSCFLSKILVINNPGYYPMYWPEASLGSKMIVLPWDATNTWEDVGKTCNVIRSHKQFLFALGLHEGSSDIYDGVRWSSPADVNGVPETWDELDTTNVAGFTQLGGEGGAIIDGLSLRDAFVIYRESAISVFDYVGGPYVWQIRNLSSTFGLISHNCIVEANAKHYFIGTDNIYINDGNSIEPLLNKKIATKFNAIFDKSKYNNAFAVRYNEANEIWFCIPSFDVDLAVYAYIYNYIDGTLSIIELPFGGVAHAAYGSVSKQSPVWNTTSGSWNSQENRWNISSNSSIVGSLVGCINSESYHAMDPDYPYPASYIMDLDVNETYEKFIPVTTDPFIERQGLSIEGLDNNITLTRLYPHMDGNVPVTIMIGSQQTTNGDVHWKYSEIYQPGVDRKVDSRATGELHCWRISGDKELGGSWSITGIDIEYVNAGKR
jgi:hypothetical protein